MVAPSCLRCLARPTSLALPSRAVASPLSMPTPSISFSTTTKTCAAPPKPKSGAPSLAGMSKHVRAGKKMNLSRLKRKRTIDRGKPPLPGERKAFRKRIQLSNNNALPVAGLEPLSSRALLDTSNAGRVLALPDGLVDQLRVAEAFKTTQSWGMFRHPSVLVRAETAELAGRMEASAAQKDTLRIVLAGDRLVGKSMLLLQAISYAYLDNWVVFNVPEAQELTNASTDYAPLAGTDPVQYSQQAYALRMIQTLRKANEPLLAELKTVHSHPELAAHFPVGSSLLQLAHSAKDADTAWPTLDALWQELTVAGHGRRPILLALDGLAHVMRVSDYRSPAFELIHAHDLALVRRFVGLLSGAARLPNGGAVVAATSRGNSPRSPSMDLALAQREAEQLKTPKAMPKRNPFFKGYDERVASALSGVQVLRLGGASKAEARALMEYWAASGVLRAAVDEPTVSEKWTLGGNGVLGEMERAALLTMRL